MRFYNIHITAFHKYLFERDYTIQAGSDSVAASKALKEFWREPVNKRRKRATQRVKVEIQLK